MQVPHGAFDDRAVIVVANGFGITVQPLNDYLEEMFHSTLLPFTGPTPPRAILWPGAGTFIKTNGDAVLVPVEVCARVCHGEDEEEVVVIDFYEPLTDDIVIGGFHLCHATLANTQDW